MKTKPRIIFNCDGDSTTLAHFEPPITPRQLCRAVDELKGTQVDVFIYCINRGDDTFSHRTNVAEIYGLGITEWDVPLKYRSLPGYETARRKVLAMKRMADNTRALLDAGYDPMAVLAGRTHEHGMAFWAGLRMNDIHEDDPQRFFVLRSRYKKEHSDLLIGSPYPNPSEGYGGEDFTWAFNFEQATVRERKIALIEEACLNYDVDGFELDFQRGPWYFKPGREKQGTPLMTDFLRQVRAQTRAIALKKGKRFTLAARVPPTFDAGEQKGLDVRTWIREELADIFIPMDAGYMNMDFDVGGFVAAVRETSCIIAGGIEPYTKDGGRSDLNMFRAAASGYYQQGAECLYLFNFDCHRVQGRDRDYTDWEMQALREIGAPRTMAEKGRP